MNIGFVSTRFAGTDGVTLESAKWSEVLARQGHEAFWFSGLSDRDPKKSFCVPEAFFEDPENQWLNERMWGCEQRDALVTERVHEVARYLKEMLRRFVHRFEIEVLVLENVLAIPVHVPLGVAITEFLAETNMRAVAHHHDFFWERHRFAVNAIPDFLDMAFPPRLPNLRHAVINERGQEELARRKAVNSVLVPNVFEFEKSAPELDDYSQDVRAELGLKKEDIMILQPTRLIPRKGIELAIQLIARLKDPRCKLVLTHEAGDEGWEYREMLTDLAKESEVPLIFANERIAERRYIDDDGRKIYTLWDIYPHADLISYPSLYEGFGNALLEAFYFRKPVVVNRYQVYEQDIASKGFEAVTLNGYLTSENVEEVRRLLKDPQRQENMVETNYELARKHYGYVALERQLRLLF